MPGEKPGQSGDPKRKDPITPSQPKAPAPQKMADKPHRITILLAIGTAVLAALVALVGSWLTYRGQRFTRTSQEISQQPYVVVTSGRLDFIPLVAGPPPQPTSGVQPRTAIINPEPAGPFLGTDISVTIVNSGNTAATFVSFKASFDRLPDGWSLRKRVMPEEKPAYLTPKSQVIWHYHQPFNLTPEAWDLFHKGWGGSGILKYLTFVGELVYRDEYLQEHTTRWCWQTAADATNNGTNGQVWPCM
jgi:hypothetical protein